MTSIPKKTIERLHKLTQIPSVWEGSRSTLPHLNQNNDLIIWVDGSEGAVRIIDSVPTKSGHEATVRALIRSMTSPQPPARPARPQKIIVRDRELQFLLRGVLQDLDIIIDYVGELPVIDELVERINGFQPEDDEEPENPYSDLLIEKACDIWALAPWELLADHQVLAITIKAWEIDTLYATVMGMLGQEYGVVFYRSLDSLMRFRAAAITTEDSPEVIEQAFLNQDCLFLTFDTEEEESTLTELMEIQPNFGSIHPFEGMRSHLDEDEALTLVATMDCLQQFLIDHQKQLSKNFPNLSKAYSINLPNHPEPICISIQTMPELEKELIALEETEEAEIAVKTDLIPNGSFHALGMMPWDVVQTLRHVVKYHQVAPEIHETGEGLPIILVQTTRPKAKTLVESIVAMGGIAGVGFALGEDTLGEPSYDLCILKTNDGELNLIAEFDAADPKHLISKEKWHQRIQMTKHHCGFIVAQGLTGASKGNPQLRDMVALFEARALDEKGLGVGTLQMIPLADW